MPNQIIAYTEEMVGSGHPTKSDTLNRALLIDHGTDGQHTLAGFEGSMYAADAEASDTYVVTLDPVPAAYFTGMVVNFKANTANTGAATLNVNSLGAKSIKKNFDQALMDGDIASGQIVTVVYDGTNFQMQSQSAKGIELGDAATNAETALGSSTTQFTTPDDIKFRHDSETENITEIIQYPIPTSGYMLKAAADGSPATGTNTDTDVADAVTKKHTQNTDTGTTATSFKINTGGSEADLQTTGLTADRDYTFPDIDTMLAGSVLMAQNISEIIEYTP